jgi:hypothetical protein
MANTPATTVTPDNKAVTILTVRADMTISEEKVAINAEIGESFFLQLTKEAVIGSPMSVAYWLQDVYEVEGEAIKLLTLPEYYDTSAAFANAYRIYKTDTKPPQERDLYKQIKANLEKNNIPAAARNIMTTAFLAQVSITDLLIQTKKDEKNIMFGIAVYFPAPLQLLPNVDVDRISLLIKHSSTGDFKNFPTRKPELGGPPASATEDQAIGEITFTVLPAAKDTITLGSTDWGFGTSASEKITSIEDTVTALAKELNASDDKNIKKCTYTASGKKLVITFKDGGSAGNDFQIGVSGEFGKASATTLRGGGGAPIADKTEFKAKGSIKFFKVITPDVKITLKATDWTFSAAGGKRSTKFGRTITATVAALADELNKVTDDDENIGKCTYRAANRVLEIEYNTDGEEGNEFPFTVLPPTIAKASGPTLTGGSKP